MPDNKKPGNKAQEIRRKYKNQYVADGREQWGEYLSKKLPFSKKPVKDVVYSLSNQYGISPQVLYTSSMEEGLRLGIDNPDNISEAYLNFSKKSPDQAQRYPVDGFYNYGLDTFGDRYEGLIANGYLPKDFESNFTPYEALNEKNEKVRTAAFINEETALQAKAALLKELRDNVSSYAKSRKVNLSPRQLDFFTVSAYNAGEGNARKMMGSYQQKGYLKDDGFLAPSFKPASYLQPYTYVQRRLVNADVLDKEGYFSDYRPAAQQKQVMDFGGMVDPVTAYQIAEYVRKQQEANSLPPGAGQLVDLKDATNQLGYRGVGDPALYNDSGIYQPKLPGPSLGVGKGKKFNVPIGDIMTGLVTGAGALATEYIDKPRRTANEMRLLRNQLLPVLAGPSVGGYDMPILSRFGGRVDRRATMPAMANIVAEGGEFLQLPDGETDAISGDSHSDPSGGVYMNLPIGSKIYSDKLKVEREFASDLLGRKVKKKFSVADIAKKYNTKHEDGILKDSTADPISKRSANIMKTFKQTQLNRIFDYQESLKGTAVASNRNEGAVFTPKARYGIQVMDNGGRKVSRRPARRPTASTLELGPPKAVMIPDLYGDPTQIVPPALPGASTVGPLTVPAGKVPVPDNSYEKLIPDNGKLYVPPNTTRASSSGSAFKGDSLLQDLLPEAVALIQNQTNFPIFTAKYQPRYLRPAEMNIQASLNQNYAQTRPLLESTGNPSIDNARAAQAAANLFDANNQLFEQKFNFDTQNRYQTDQFNVNLENQANQLNLQRADQFWDKVTARQAVKEATTNNITNSAYTKFKKKNLENRSMKLVGQMFENFKYDPSKGIYFDPNTGQQYIFHEPTGQLLGIGNLNNIGDDIETTRTTRTNGKGVTAQTLRQKEKKGS